MSEVKKTEETGKHDKIRDLPITEKELTDEEQQQLKGGSKMNLVSQKIDSIDWGDGRSHG